MAARSGFGTREASSTAPASTCSPSAFNEKEQARMSVKQHGTAIAIAVAASAGLQQALPPKTVEKPVAVTVAASRFAWPDLSDAEISALGARVKWLSKTRLQIF